MTATPNIDLPDDGACAFCAYLRGERPYTILCRTNDTATLVTREQRGDPHLLVIPIRHMPTVLDLTDQEAASLAISVRNAARMIDRAYAKPGIAVWQNNGVPAGQAVSHLHFHVAGTLKRGGTDWGKVDELNILETERIAARLRE
ncbi:HIT family protein [Hydrocarboniphaga effusa]|uniref:HIT family protein n=1 Tax=Hydrocarboniphaga effusa TaxID=243629 RepID=UPI0031381D97